jgi:O-methyltransferase
MKHESQRQSICTEIKGISFTDQIGIFNVWDLTQQAIDEGVEGDFAEAGVTAGANPIVMSHVLKLNDIHDRRVRMFDSFCGHPKCKDIEHDEHKRHYGERHEDDILVSANGTQPDVQNAKNFVKRFNGYEEIIDYHAGWFQDTLPTLPEFKLALLRTDCNLIESHELCMKYLYPRISKGGYYISDDYATPGIRIRIDKFVKKNKIKMNIIGSENHIVWWKK